jgi:hypothetical protein
MDTRPGRGKRDEERQESADGDRIVRKDQQVSFAIYVLVVSLVVAIMGVLLFLFGDGPAYVTAVQMRTYVDTQAPECRPIARARLKRRLVQEGKPLRSSDVRSVLREIDASDCGTASMQLEALEAPDRRTDG